MRTRRSGRGPLCAITGHPPTAWRTGEVALSRPSSLILTERVGNTIPPSRRGFLWPAGHLAAQTAGSQVGLVEPGRTATSTHCQASRQPAKGARAPERQSAEPPPRDAGSSTLQTVHSLGRSWVVLRIDKFIWRARNPNEMRRKGGQPPCRVVALAVQGCGA
jgi:hypothetical protein